jgi:DNA-binding HxlR family transcriptional regulator
MMPQRQVGHLEPTPPGGTMPQLATLKRQIRQPRPVKERRSKTARTLHERNCSVGRTVAILSDSWAFLVLRESYFGATRFEAFQLALGIPRQTLTQRLRMLTVQGLLHRVQYSERPKRSEYRLTDMGFDLYPVMLALLAFGNKWLCRSKKPPVELIHNACGAVCHPVVACSRCKEAVTSRTVSYREGPGAGVTRVRVGKRYRRSSDPAVLDRGRPSMVAETLKIIGDRWSFMVITEAFFGIRQFDQWQQKLGIASNILTDRLNRLVADGIFERRKYQDLPLRFEYRFTEKGKDLYGPLIAMLRWGDRWLSHGKPPLILTHHVCKQDFEATVICDHCRQPLYAQDMGYQLSYRPKHDERSKKPGRAAGGGRTRIIFPLCERSA